MAPLRRLRPENDNELPLESIEEQLDREAVSSELIDVPAAVVCLVCGEADCTGCEERDRSRSGIVAVVAWERPGLPVLTRLWSTARSTTRDADAFFELLPDGPVLPALRFAALSELFAVCAMVITVVAIAAVVAPSLLSHLAFDPHARGVALRVIALGVPGFAALMVLGHVAHGFSIDVGATRSGARRARSRALRFGLYACGWDLVMGPLGAIVVAIKEGIGAALGLVDLASVPTRATRAFLLGCYGLEGERAKKALATGSAGVVAVLACAVFTVLVTIVAVALKIALG